MTTSSCATLLTACCTEGRASTRRSCSSTRSILARYVAVQFHRSTINNFVGSISGFDNRREDAEHADRRVHLPRVLDTPTPALPSKVLATNQHHALILSRCLFSPKTVFIMGGGEGSAAREVLRHKTVQRVVMCDIDQEVVDFCRTYLTVNRQAFSSEKLCLVINDARAELEKSKEKFDVIVGDLADPVKGGPCYHLYTKSFYELIVKPKLNNHGIFVTQAGPAGVLTHKQVFSSIYNTLRNVFKYVQAYTAHVPSFADTWGWVMASDHPFDLTAQQINERIGDRIEGELAYLTGEFLISSTTLNKSVHQSLLNETHIYTEDDTRFIYGHGRACRA